MNLSKMSIISQASLKLGDWFITLFMGVNYIILPNLIYI